MVCTRDIDFAGDDQLNVEAVMTKDLVVAREGCSLSEANELMKSSKKGKLPIVNDKGQLVALISRTDLLKHRDYPLSSVEKHSKQLLCGAAVGTRDSDRQRVAALAAVHVDVIVIDSAQGDSTFQVRHDEHFLGAVRVMNLGSCKFARQTNKVFLYVCSAFRLDVAGLARIRLPQISGWLVCLSRGVCPWV
jgi:hypothetical protein